MASNRRLFREEAFARRGKTEPLNGLLRVTAPHEWVILVFLAIALLGLAGWGLFGSVEQSVAAQCVLAHPGDRFTVVAESSGNVVELLAEVGDTVAAGQPIARMRTPDLSREIAIARSRVDLLESKDAKMSDALEVARLELIELEARQAAGAYIATPFAGVITSYNLSIGQLVTVGTSVAHVRAGAGSELEAVALISQQDAAGLEKGMAAQVMTPDRDRKSMKAMSAELQFISAKPVTPPEWLRAMGLPAIARGHLVQLALREPAASTLADGDACDLRIVLRRVTPVRLLLSAGSR